MSAKKDNIIHEICVDKFKGCCYDRVHYFINEEKETIVCKLEPFTTIEDWFENINFDAGMTANRNFFDYCEDMGITFIGKAVCLKEDTFDIEFGKKLAYDKAVFKLLNHKRRFFENTIKTFEENINCVKREIANLDTNREQVTRRYENKMKEVTS